MMAARFSAGSRDDKRILIPASRSLGIACGGCKGLSSVLISLVKQKNLKELTANY
jgi:hypothetical protein